MNDVRVSKARLLDIVTKNRDDHRGLFVKAQEGFRARAIEELDGMLKAAQQGDVRLYVGLTAPQDHTVEYDRAIQMLGMSEDDTILVDQQTFAQLVRNEWAWFDQSTAINSTYASGGKLGGSR